MRLGEIGIGRACHAKKYTTDIVSVLLRREVAEAAPILLVGNDPQHDVSETLQSLGSGLPIGVSDPSPLWLRKLSLEISSF